MPSKEEYYSAINSRLRDDPKWRKDVVLALEKFEKTPPSLIVHFSSNEPDIAIPVEDIFCQTSRPDQLKFEDKIATVALWSSIIAGNIMYRFVQVKSQPRKDKDIEGNQAILTDMIGRYPNLGIKEATFFEARQSGEDGQIVFEKPFINNFQGLVILPNGKPSRKKLLPPADGKATRFPLEVGYCMPDQINWHLGTHGALARFPYKTNIIVFLERRRRAIDAL
jgi:hypothetical protein